jgi:hypothetical protein
VAISSRLEDFLRSCSGGVLTRGRRYADEGRVLEVSHDGATVRAVVAGTDNYDVVLGPEAAECTCPAYDRDGECKHLAAVALTLRGVPLAERPARRPPRELGVPPLPSFLRDVYATGTFLSRLSLHAGSRIDVRVEQWLPLGDWWRRGGPGTAPLRERVLAYANEIAADLEIVRTWTPPPPPLPGTAYASFYEELATRYVRRASEARIKRAAPGPLSRHPGFVASYDGKRRVLAFTERSSPLLGEPLTLSIRVPRDPSEEIRIDEVDTYYGGVDAFHLFALRAALLALAAGEVPAIEEELGRPTCGSTSSIRSSRSRRKPSRSTSGLSASARATAGTTFSPPSREHAAAIA